MFTLFQKLKPEQKLFVLIVLIFVIASILSVYIWSSYRRYYLTMTSDGTAYQIDRKTGKSWLIKGNAKSLIKDESTPQSSALPFEECLKIEGQAYIGTYGRLSWSLYNRTTWHITKLLVTVSAGQEDGTSWTRHFIVTEHLYPFRNEFFDLYADRDLANIHAWTITKAFGYKDETDQVVAAMADPWVQRAEEMISRRRLLNRYELLDIEAEAAATGKDKYELLDAAIERALAEDPPTKLHLRKLSDASARAEDGKEAERAAAKDSIENAANEEEE